VERKKAARFERPLSISSEIDVYLAVTAKLAGLD